MEINIDELIKITTLLLLKLKESKGNKFEMEHDYYWHISEEEIYDPYKVPKVECLGQISDELQEISRLLKSDDAIPHDLMRVSEILKCLSIENPIAF